VNQRSPIEQCRNAIADQGRDERKRRQIDWVHVVSTRNGIGRGAALERSTGSGDTQDPLAQDAA
jgi:hypothetical protein